MVLKTGRVHAVFLMCSVPVMGGGGYKARRGGGGKGSWRWAMEGRGRAASPSRFATLPLLLLALELPQASCPNVPPLDHQAVLIGHKAQALRPWTGGPGPGRDTCTRRRARSAVTAAHHQEPLAHLDLRTLAGQVLHVHPQDVVAPLQGIAAALVHGHHVHWELGPVAHRLHVQDVHLDRWGHNHGKHTQISTPNTADLPTLTDGLFYCLTIVLLAVFLHVDLQVALHWFTIRLTICKDKNEQGLTHRRSGYTLKGTLTHMKYESWLLHFGSISHHYIVHYVLLLWHINSNHL